MNPWNYPLSKCRYVRKYVCSFSLILECSSLCSKCSFYFAKSISIKYGLFPSQVIVSLKSIWRSSNSVSFCNFGNYCTKKNVLCICYLFLYPTYQKYRYSLSIFFVLLCKNEKIMMNRLYENGKFIWLLLCHYVVFPFSE